MSATEDHDFPARSPEWVEVMPVSEHEAALVEARAEVEKLRLALDEVEALAGNPGYNAVFDLAGDISAVVITARPSPPEEGEDG